MVNNVDKNAINEILAKKHLNAFNQIKNAEIKNTRLICKEKELLNLFNILLDTILTENKNTNTNNNDNNNENENENENKIKQLNDSLDKMIDESKSFEKQIKLFKKVKDLNQYWHCSVCGDKELKFEIFELNLANYSNFIDEKLFAEIFGYTLVTLANKLMNKTNKEENQIIVNDIEKNKKKLYEEDETDPFHDYVIQPSSRRIDLIHAVNLILHFNKTIQLDLL